MSNTTLTWFGPVLLALAAFGCTGGGGGTTPYTPPDPVPVTQPAEPNLAGLPLSEEGNPIFIATEQTEISVDTSQRGPTSALASCMAVIEQCWREQGLNADNQVRVMDLCERSAPTCATAEPWNEAPCCPAACWDRYEAGRAAGQEPAAVEDEIYYGADPCIAGVPPTTGGTP